MVKHKSSYKPRVIAGIAAYNEEKYIGTVILKTSQYADEIIVIDDGSTDNTSNVASLANATVIRHKKNEGKGAAIRRILAETSKKKLDVLVLLDADAQHNPDEIPDLIKPVISDGFDLVIGSREHQKDRIPRYRRIGQQALSKFSSVLSDGKSIDSECGFRALSPKAIAELKLQQDGFAVESEMITVAAEKGLRITEVPVSAIYTKDGSTLNPVSHGLGVLTWIISTISEKKPLFFFGIPGIILAIAGFLLGIWVADTYLGGGRLPIGSAMVSALLLFIGILSIFTAIILNSIAKLRS